MLDPWGQGLETPVEAGGVDDKIPGLCSGCEHGCEMPCELVGLGYTGGRERRVRGELCGRMGRRVVDAGHRVHCEGEADRMADYVDCFHRHVDLDSRLRHVLGVKQE